MQSCRRVGVRRRAVAADRTIVWPGQVIAVVGRWVRFGSRGHRGCFGVQQAEPSWSRNARTHAGPTGRSSGSELHGPGPSHPAARCIQRGPDSGEDSGPPIPSAGRLARSMRGHECQGPLITAARPRRLFRARSMPLHPFERQAGGRPRPGTSLPFSPVRADSARAGTCRTSEGRQYRARPQGSSPGEPTRSGA